MVVWSLFTTILRCSPHSSHLGLIRRSSNRTNASQNQAINCPKLKAVFFFLFYTYQQRFTQAAQCACVSRLPARLTFPWSARLVVGTSSTEWRSLPSSLRLVLPLDGQAVPRQKCAAVGIPGTVKGLNTLWVNLQESFTAIRRPQAKLYVEG